MAVVFSLRYWFAVYCRQIIFWRAHSAVVIRTQRSAVGLTAGCDCLSHDAKIASSHSHVKDMTRMTHKPKLDTISFFLRTYLFS